MANQPKAESRKGSSICVDKVEGAVLKSLLGSRQVSLFDSYRDVIEPVYNPDEWAEMMELSTRYKQCVQITARNTVGLGWSIEAADYAALNGEEKAAVDESWGELESLLSRPNPEHDFTMLCGLVKTDELSCGSGYMEVIRDDDNVIRQLFHMPAKTVRIMKDGLFVQRKTYTSKAHYFKPFGSGLRISRDTGKPVAIGGKGVLASEVLMFKVYSPIDPTYGVPPGSTCDIAVGGIHQVDVRNYNFFESDAMPRFVVMLQGGSTKDIEAVEEVVSHFVKHVRGETKVARAMVLQGPASRGDQRGGIEFKEVGQYSKDATFREYRKDCNEEIREAFGLAKVLFGTADDVNRASALATLDGTVRNVFWPQATSWEYRLAGIAREFHPRLAIKLVRATATDLLAQAEVTKTYTETKLFTTNELRRGAGYTEIEEDWADVPLIKLDVGDKAAEEQRLAKTFVRILEEKFAELRGAKSAGGRRQG